MEEKVGTGKLRPFEKGSTGSKSIEGSTNQEHVRSGFTENVMIEKATRNVTELTAFEKGPSGPGRNQNKESVPDFHERKSCGIDWEEYKAFEE
jgi:hypothetical protein